MYLSSINENFISRCISALKVRTLTAGAQNAPVFFRSLACCSFMKIKQYAVLNLNNMFPVPKTERTYVDINRIADVNYKNLLRKEYRFIKVNEKKIMKNAQVVYSHKIHSGNKTNLGKRCNDFLLLEEKAKLYKNNFLVP